VKRSYGWRQKGSNDTEWHAQDALATISLTQYRLAKSLAKVLTTFRRLDYRARVLTRFSTTVIGILEHAPNGPGVAEDQRQTLLWPSRHHNCVI